MSGAPTKFHVHSSNNITPSVERHPRKKCCDNQYGTLSKVVFIPSILDLVVGTIFWLWSVINILRGVLELGGVVTFLIAMIAGLNGIVLVHSRDKPRHVKLALSYYILISLAHISVTVDYAVAAFIYTEQVWVAISIR